MSLFVASKYFIRKINIYINETGELRQWWQKWKKNHAKTLTQHQYSNPQLEKTKTHAQ